MTPAPGPAHRQAVHAPTDGHEAHRAGSDGDLRGLVQRMAHGDAQALAVLYDELVPGVARMARLVLGGADVSEVVRATFVELWVRAPDPGLTHGLPVEAWALGRAHHHARTLEAAGRPG